MHMQMESVWIESSTSFLCTLFMRTAKDLVHLHICTRIPESSLLANAIRTKICLDSSILVLIEKFAYTLPMSIHDIRFHRRKENNYVTGETGDQDQQLLLIYFCSVYGRCIEQILL